MDTTAPTLTLSANLTVDATSASGAVVSFTVTATDLVDGPTGVTCTPASGATFPIGTSTVYCSTTDAHGNTAAGAFAIRVRSASEQLQALHVVVVGLPPGTSLSAKVNAAIQSLQSGNTASTCSSLNALIHEAQAPAGKELTVAQANQLVADATRIRAVLAC